MDSESCHFQCEKYSPFNPPPLPHYLRRGPELNSEPKFEKLLRSPGIDSQSGRPLRQPYLTYRPTRSHKMAESIPWNQFLGSLNVYKFGPRPLTNVFSYMLNDRTMFLPLFIYSLEWREGADASQHSYMQKKVQVVCQPYSVKNSSSLAQCFSFINTV